MHGSTDGRQSWRIWSEKNIGETSPVAPGEFWLVSLGNGWILRVAAQNGEKTEMPCFYCQLNQFVSGWWFQICFIFTPPWGNDPI